MEPPNTHAKTTAFAANSCGHLDWRGLMALQESLGLRVIGEGLEVQDLYGDWLRQREIEEDGVI